MLPAMPRWMTSVSPLSRSARYISPAATVRTTCRRQPPGEVLRERDAQILAPRLDMREPVALEARLQGPGQHGFDFGQFGHEPFRESQACDGSRM